MFFTHLTFLVSYIALLAALLFILLRTKISLKGKVGLLFLHTVMLHFAVQLSYPSDSLDFQAMAARALVDGIVARGHWTTQFAELSYTVINSYAEYPVLYLLLSAVQFVTDIDTKTLVQFSMCAIHPVSILFVYELYRRLVGQQKMALLATYLFSLTPWFDRFGSITSYDSLAFLFSVIILWNLFTSKNRIVMIVALVAVALSHHFTVFLLLVALLAISAGGFIFNVKEIAFDPGPQRTAMCVMLLASISLTWSSYIAILELRKYVVSYIPLRLIAPLWEKLVPAAPSIGVRPPFVNSLIVLATLIFYLLAAYGVARLVLFRDRLKSFNRVVSLLPPALLFGLMYFVLIFLTKDIDKERIMTSFHLFVAPFGVIGLYSLLNALKLGTHASDNMPEVSFDGTLERAHYFIVTFVLLLVISTGWAYWTIPDHGFEDMPVARSSDIRWAPEEWAVVSLLIKNTFPMDKTWPTSPKAPLFSTYRGFVCIETVGQRHTFVWDEVTAQKGSYVLPEDLLISEQIRWWSGPQDGIVFFQSNCNIVGSNGKITIYKS